MKETGELNKSQSDYRSISLSFNSSDPLTRGEVEFLDILAQRLMETAEKASNGEMTKQGFKLAEEFRGLEGLFESVELNANYVGAGQNKTKMEVEILNQTISAELDLDKNQESSYDMQRYWDY